MKTPKISFTAVGDMLIQRMISTKYEGFDQIRDYICKGDARFFNLETTLHRGEHWGNQFNGGSFHNSDPRMLDVAKEYGFNMVSFANNHTFDFGYGGLQSTLNAVRDAGFVNAGVGMNLAEASDPVYLDTPTGRIALIAATSSFVNDAALAGHQSRRVIGRPGVNGLRLNERMEVTREQFEVIRQAIEDSGINASLVINRAEGYNHTVAEENTVDLGNHITFHAGERSHYHATINKKDLARVERAIYEAQAQADYILISIHCHQISGSAKETPPDFLVEFCRHCIDLGAHAVLGHGPHLLRPLEIYKNRPIFYSLGDFMLHNESVTFAPEDMYEKFGMTSADPLCDIYRKRSRNYTCGLLTDHRMMEAVIPYFEMEDGVLTHLELMPIELGFGQPRYRLGNPVFCPDKGILERLEKISSEFGTKIRIDENGIGIVKLEA